MCHFAILFGIPIEKDEYFSRINKSDYLRKYRSNPEKNWVVGYNKLVAEPLRNLANQARTMEWEVYSGATLGDFKEVVKTAKVVVLVSHWKSYVFSNDDLIQPIDETEFAAAATQSSEPLAQWLVQAFEQKQMDDNASVSRPFLGWFDAIKDLWKSDKTLRDILEEALDVTIENELPLPAGISEYVESDLTRRTRRRLTIDNVFSGLISPGNRLELFDGLYDCMAISKAIDEQFKGVLDLTTCTSTILADHISTYHQYSFRVMQFSKNQEPRWAAATLSATLNLMSRGYSYLDARQQSIQLVRKIAKSKIAKLDR